MPFMFNQETTLGPILEHQSQQLNVPGVSISNKRSLKFQLDNGSDGNPKNKKNDIESERLYDKLEPQVKRVPQMNVLKVCLVDFNHPRFSDYIEVIFKTIAKPLLCSIIRCH